MDFNNIIVHVKIFKKDADKFAVMIRKVLRGLTSKESKNILEKITWRTNKRTLFLKFEIKTIDLPVFLESVVPFLHTRLENDSPIVRITEVDTPYGKATINDPQDTQTYICQGYIMTLGTEQFESPESVKVLLERLSESMASGDNIDSVERMRSVLHKNVFSPF